MTRGNPGNAKVAEMSKDLQLTIAQFDLVLTVRIEFSIDFMLNIAECI